MKISSVSIKDIAKFLDADFKGDASILATGINEIHMVEKGDIVFVNHPKYYETTLNSEASVILIDKEVEVEDKTKGIIITSDPFASFNKLIEKYSDTIFSEKSYKPIQVGKNTIIHPSVYIGKNVTIEDNCRIYPNVCLMDNTIIKNNVYIKSNAVIGGDAFYFNKTEQGHTRLISCGRTIIEDNVEVGSNTCIDRGVTGDTIIGKGSKIDNLVQIGHDTHIGKNAIIASLAAIAGCTKVGNDVVLWGKSGLIQNIEVGDKAVVLAGSIVTKSVAGHEIYYGNPAKKVKEKLRESAMISRMVREESKK